MKYKRISFSILEKVKKKKIEKEIINIKNLYLKKQQNNEQLKLLINYQKEYIKKINDKMILGVCIYQWKNYNNFIYLLHTIIRDNINIIQQNQKIIEDSLKKLTDYKIKLKIWEYLSEIDKKKKFKIKKIQEQTLNDNYAQLKILNKDNY